jgi:ADP-ribosylglycohydrolase
MPGSAKNMNTEPPKIPGAFLRLMDTEQLRTLLRLEIQEKEEEGFDVVDLWEELKKRTAKTQLAGLYNKLLNARRVKEFKFIEPDTLTEIRGLRPKGPRAIQLEIDSATLYDRIYGGWLGRIAGCVLGKPVEPWGQKESIIAYLKLAGNYPLANYIPRLNPYPSGSFLGIAIDGTCLNEIHGAPQDDDTDYTVLGIHLMEMYGLVIKTSNVANEWLEHLAYARTYTAERAAYRNLILGIPPERTASLLNPEREYIGARIRADIYGLTCPGRPELAATLAYQDAALSHTKNGIYSAMFMAAMLAWSFVTDDIQEIIQVGLSEIPRKCRLTEAVSEVLALHSKIADWEGSYERLLPKQAAYHPVHAINNTVWLVLALVYGNRDFEKTICTAVMCGFDADCNGANAGTVLGVLAGAQALPHKWIDPLENTLKTALAGYGDLRISDLACRTVAVAETCISKFSDKE